MLDFTKAEENLKTIYKSLGQDVIKRMPFNYKNHRINIWYLEEQGFNIIQIEIMNDDVVVFINNTIPYYEGSFHIDTWVPSKEYDALKYSLFKQDNWLPKALYEHIAEIISTDTIDSYESHTKDDLYNVVREVNGRTANEENLIYFSHLRTARVGKTIEQRLRRMMSYSEAQDIIKKLKKINKTLVFTDNPNESRDLYAAISKEEQLTINR